MCVCVYYEVMSLILYTFLYLKTSINSRNIFMCERNILPKFIIKIDIIRKEKKILVEIRRDTDI